MKRTSEQSYIEKRITINYKKPRKNPYDTFAISSSVLNLFNELSLNHNFLSQPGRQISEDSPQVLDAESKRFHNDATLVGMVFCFSGPDEFGCADTDSGRVRIIPLEIVVEARSFYTEYSKFGRNDETEAEEVLKKVKQERNQLKELIFNIVKENYDGVLDAELKHKKLGNNNYSKLSEALLKIWQTVNSCEFAEHFRCHVDKEKAPDYDEIISNPINLEEIRMKIEEKHYKNVKEFFCDFELLQNNCYKYNQKGIGSNFSLLEKSDKVISLLYSELDKLQPWEDLLKYDFPEEKQLFIKNGLILAREQTFRPNNSDSDDGSDDED